MKNDGLNSEISGHFGQAPLFLIVTLKEQPENKRVIREEDINDVVSDVSAIQNLREHACASVVDLLTNQNIDILLVEGIGGRPFELFRQRGVKLYTGAFGTIREIIRDFLNGMLNQLESASCGHHDHSDHSHFHPHPH